MTAKAQRTESREICINNLGGTDDEKQKNLGIFKKWVGSWNLKKRAEITDAELKAITAPENNFYYALSLL